MTNGTIKYRGYWIERTDAGFAMTYRNRRTDAVLSGAHRKTLAQAKADVDARCRAELGL